jgi:hypothetical protein
MHETLLRRTVIAHREQTTLEAPRRRTAEPLALDGIPEFQPFHELFTAADVHLPRPVRRHEREAARALSIVELQQMVGALEDTMLGEDESDDSMYDTAARVRRVVRRLA